MPWTIIRKQLRVFSVNTSHHKRVCLVELRIRGLFYLELQHQTSLIVCFNISAYKIVWQGPILLFPNVKELHFNVKGIKHDLEDPPLMLKYYSFTRTCRIASSHSASGQKLLYVYILSAIQNESIAPLAHRWQHYRYLLHS